jgi:hypothetical protein
LGNYSLMEWHWLSNAQYCTEQNVTKKNINRQHPNEAHKMDTP